MSIWQDEALSRYDGLPYDFMCDTESRHLVQKLNVKDTWCSSGNNSNEIRINHEIDRSRQYRKTKSVVESGYIWICNICTLKIYSEFLITTSTGGH